MDVVIGSNAWKMPGSQSGMPFNRVECVRRGIKYMF